MQDTEFILDPAANYVKFLMIVIGMIMHTVVIHVTAMIMTAIMQVGFRIVPDYLVPTELRMNLDLYAFTPLILIMISMMNNRTLATIRLALVKMYVTGAAMPEFAEASFAYVPVAGHFALYLLAVPRYLIAMVMTVTRVSLLLRRMSTEQRSVCTPLSISLLLISSVLTAPAWIEMTAC